jgi:hypothetical protein
MGGEIAGALATSRMSVRGVEWASGLSDRDLSAVAAISTIGAPGRWKMTQSVHLERVDSRRQFRDKCCYGSKAMTLTGDVLSSEGRTELLVPMYLYLLMWFFLYCYPIARATAALERRLQISPHVS